jgi:hypothetical protein
MYDILQCTNTIQQVVWCVMWAPAYDPVTKNIYNIVFHSSGVN